MNITVLNYSGRSLAGLLSTESARTACADACVYDAIVEGRFASFDEAEAYAQRKLVVYYIARDDVTGEYLVFSHVAA